MAEVLGVVIGMLLVVLGIFFQNMILIILGLAAALLFAIFNKPAKAEYVPIETGRKERHIIIQSKPPAEHFPGPGEAGGPLPKPIVLLGRGVDVGANPYKNVKGYEKLHFRGYEQPGVLEKIFLHLPFKFGRKKEDKKEKK